MDSEQSNNNANGGLEKPEEKSPGRDETDRFSCAQVYTVNIAGDRQDEASNSINEAELEMEHSRHHSKHRVRLQKKNGRYYFQHPYARLFVAYFVIFCNFLIYAEDPVSHSRANCTIPLVGNDFAFVTYMYPPRGWSVLKVFMWLLGIIIGLFIGKFFFHKLVFNRLLRLQMFYHDSGSWMVMFLTTLISLFIFSFIYNGFLSLGGDELSLYKITTYLGLQNDSFMKAAGLGTWMGDFVTAWMVTDMMLQDKLYPDWNKKLRKIWRTGWTRIYLFWIVLIISTSIVASGIITDFVNWDTLNRDFVSTNELSRAFLASFILVMDLLIVMQDWEFPQFQGNLDVKLPGVDTASFYIRLPRFLKKENWTVHITGKWFNYGIIMLVIILDLNMWKNQIFYSPFLFGQYTDNEGYIYTVKDENFLKTANESLLSYDWRSQHINPDTNQSYALTDPRMNSKYLAFALGVKSIAFIPSIVAFLTFGTLIWLYGREEFVVETTIVDGDKVDGVVVETLGSDEDIAESSRLSEKRLTYGEPSSEIPTDDVTNAPVLRNIQKVTYV